MHKNSLLVVLAGAGVAVAWWPMVFDARLGLPVWLPLVIVALVTAFSTLLSGGRWRRFLLASVVGTFSGLCGHFAICVISNRIAAADAPVIIAVIAVAMLAAALFSLSAGFSAESETSA